MRKWFNFLMLISFLSCKAFAQEKTEIIITEIDSTYNSLLIIGIDVETTI